MSEILNVIQNASPALAAAIIGLLYAVRGQKKDIEELKKRVDDYDSLKARVISNSENILQFKTEQNALKQTLSDMRADVSFIRGKMEGTSK